MEKASRSNDDGADKLNRHRKGEDQPFCENVPESETKNFEWVRKANKNKNPILHQKQRWKVNERGLFESH